MTRARLRRADALAALTAVGLLVAAHWRMWPRITTHLLMSPGGDLSAFHLCIQEWVRATAAAGHIPIWNPHLFCGYPQWAEGQLSLVGPLALLHPLPFNAALNLWMFSLHVMVALAAMWWLRTMQLAPLTALLGGLSIALSSAVLFRFPAGHPNIVACFPWLFMLAAIWNRWWAHGGVHRIGLGAIAWSMIIWSGHIQTAHGLFLWWGLLTLFSDGISSARAFRKWFVGVLCIAVLGSLAATALLLPEIEFASITPRIGYDVIASSRYSFPLENLLTLLFPGCFGYGLNSPILGDESPYMGRWGLFWEVALLLNPLILGCFMLRRTGRHARLARGLWVASITVFLLSLGRQTPVFALAHRWLPGFGVFRGHCKLIAPALFGLVALGCLRFDGFARSRAPRSAGEKPPRTMMLVALGIGISVLGLLVVSLATHLPESAIGRAARWLATLPLRGESLERFPAEASPPFPMPNIADVAPQMTSVFLASVSLALKVWTLLFAVTWIMHRAHQPHPRIAAALVAISLVWSAWNSLPYLLVHSEMAAAFPDETVRALQDVTGQSRILFLGRWPINIPMRYGFSMPNGYAALIGHRQSDFLRLAFNHPANAFETSTLVHTLGPQWRWLGIGALATVDPKVEVDEGFLYVGQIRNLHLWDVPEPTPLAFVTTNTVTAATYEEALNLQSDSEFIASGAVAIETDVDLAQGRGGRLVPLSLARPSPNEIQVDLSAAPEGWAVILESAMPGWRAWVDDKPERIAPAQVAFMAVPVAEESAILRLAYEPLSFRLGFFLTLVASMGITVLLTQRRRRLRG